MKWVGFFFVFIANISVYGQTISSARLLGMGGKSTALTDVGQLMGNPAGVLYLAGWSALISHHQDRFHEDVSTQNLMLAMPISSSTLGVRFSRYGFRDLYNEMTSSVVYGRSFGPRLSIGIGLQQYRTRIPNYLNERHYTLDAGIQFGVSDRFRLGLWLENLGRVSPIHATMRPVKTHLGVLILLNEQILMVTDAHYDAQLGLSNTWGIEYGMIPKVLLLRTGLATKPFQQYAGLGLLRDAWGIDLAFIFHQRLGTSAQIDLHYAF